MRRKVLVADLLCGAGGSSTGAARALASLGLEMELVCLNHWPVAIETHKRNHPEARHYCQDIATVRPHLIVPEGYLDLLMASPTCTHHSAARGGKPTSDQQRSDPWHIITWFTELRVHRALIENVPEFVSWGPVDPKTGKPIQERKGEYFKAWTDVMRRLGFELEWRILNAADYGDATTRRRFFLEARSDRKPLVWPVATHFKRDPGVAPGPGMKPWRAARDIIDFRIRGKSIFNRKKPLSPKTLARIYAGAKKFGWPEPFLVILRNHMGAQSVDGPVPTIAAGGNHVYLAEPVVVRTNMHGRKSPGARGAADPLMTITTDGGIGIAEAVTLANRNNNAARSAGEPIACPTTAHGGGIAVVEPLIINGRKNNKAKRVSDAPLPTLDTKGGVWLAEPFVLSRQGGGVARSIDEPTPTQCAKHSHALIAPYYGSGSGETCKSVEQPLDTVTSKGRFGMVVPVTNSNGGPAPRDDREPLPTMTTAKGGEFAFVTAAFGERPGQPPRVHDIEDPAPTICATGRVNLVEGTESYDILFRMLEPHELAAAMGFNDADLYEFTGNKTEKIKQIGNAVPVNTACALVKAVMADAAPKRQAKAGAKRRAA